MSFLLGDTSSRFVEAFCNTLGWLLVHSLWQFTAIGLILVVVLRILDRSNASIRYLLTVVAMAALVMAPAFTYFLLPSRAAPSMIADSGAVRPAIEEKGPDGVFSTDAATITAATPNPVVDPPGTTIETADDITAVAADQSSFSSTFSLITSDSTAETWLQCVVAIWTVGVALFSMRPFLGWWTVVRLRRVGVSAVPGHIATSFAKLVHRLGVRTPTEVVQSSLVHVPVVVGYFRPMVLLPTSLVSEMPMPQLEAILAHELAHVRRHDIAINVVQTVIETFFFYHPAVWWISRRLRVEREHCCDDLVVETLGNRNEYGRALLAITELRGGQSVLAVGVNDSPLVQRVRRLAGFEPVRRSWLGTVASVLILATGVIGTAWAWQAAADDPLSTKPEIEVVRTWQELHDQPAIDLETGTAKLGIEAVKGPVGSGLLLYCLTEGYHAPKEWRGSDHLGPLRIEVRSAEESHVVAEHVVAVADAERTADATMLFRRTIPLGTAGLLKVVVRTPSGDIVGQANITVADQPVHPWMPLRRVGGLIESTEAFDHLARMENVTAGRAIPFHDGTHPSMDVPKGKDMDEPTVALPKLIPQASGQLSIREINNRLLVESKDRLLLSTPDHHFLARWWVNGKPFIPPVGNVIPQQVAARVVTGKTMAVDLLCEPTRMGAKLSDKIELQLLYSRTGWQLLGSSVRSLRPQVHVNGPEVLVSNRIQLTRTQTFSRFEARFENPFANQTPTEVVIDAAGQVNYRVAEDVRLRRKSYETKFQLNAESLQLLVDALEASDWLVSDVEQKRPSTTHPTSYTLKVTRRGEVTTTEFEDGGQAELKPYRALIHFLRRLHRQEDTLRQIIDPTATNRKFALLYLNNELEVLHGHPNRQAPYLPILDWHRFGDPLRKVLKQREEASEPELQAAARTLGMLKDESTWQDIQWHYQHSERKSSATREALVDAIVAFGGKRSAEFLATEPDRFSTWTWGLIRLGDVAVPTIVKIIEAGPNKSRDVRYEQMFRAYLTHWDSLDEPIDPRVVQAVRVSMRQPAVKQRRTQHHQEFLDRVNEAAQRVWGPEHAGVAAHLHVTRNIWPMNHAVQFRSHLRNQGQTDATTGSVWAQTLEVDGQKYRADGNAAKVVVESGGVVTNLRGELTQRWVSTKNKKPLRLAPGNHALRLMFSVRANQTFEVISNPVEITIVAPMSAAEEEAKARQIRTEAAAAAAEAQRRLEEAIKRQNEKRDAHQPAETNDVQSRQPVKTSEADAAAAAEPFVIPQHTLDQARKLAAAEIARQEAAGVKRPKGLERLETDQQIQQAVETAIKDLGRLRQPHAWESDPRARLAYLGNHAFPALVQAAQSDDEVSAYQACHLLDAYGERAVSPLIQILKKHSNKRVRRAAASALGQTFHPNAVVPLIEALEDDEATVRVGAAGALAYLRDERAIEPLRKRLADPNGHIASHAIESIRQPINQGLAYWPPDKHDLRQLTIDAKTLQGESFTDGQIDTLTAHLASDSGTIRSQCMHAIAALRATRSIPKIVAAPPSYSRAHVLARMPTPLALDGLIDDLHSEEAFPRTAAISGLASGGGRWASTLLIALLDDDSLWQPGSAESLEGDERSNAWPASHQAHSALYLFFNNHGFPGEMRNLHHGATNDVRAEIAAFRDWWRRHERAFLNGEEVPNPKLSAVVDIDP